MLLCRNDLLSDWTADFRCVSEAVSTVQVASDVKEMTSDAVNGWEEIPREICEVIIGPTGGKVGQWYKTINNLIWFI